MSGEWTLFQLNALIRSAKALGFWDDVAHFTKLRDEMLAQR